MPQMHCLRAGMPLCMYIPTYAVMFVHACSSWIYALRYNYASKCQMMVAVFALKKTGCWINWKFILRVLHASLCVYSASGSGTKSASVSIQRCMYLLHIHISEYPYSREPDSTALSRASYENPPIPKYRVSANAGI